VNRYFSLFLSLFESFSLFLFHSHTNTFLFLLLFPPAVFGTTYEMGNGKMGKWANGQWAMGNGQWANGQMGKWGNGEMGNLSLSLSLSLMVMLMVIRCVVVYVLNVLVPNHKCGKRPRGVDMCNLKIPPAPPPLIGYLGLLGLLARVCQLVCGKYTFALGDAAVCWVYGLGRWKCGWVGGCVGGLA
jgi:hypothetical protein